MSMFQHLLYDTPPQTYTTDVRTPSQAAADTTRLGAVSGLLNQYGQGSANTAAAYQNPGFGLYPSTVPLLANAYTHTPFDTSVTGIPSVDQQIDIQQQIMNKQLANASASGEQGSGYANAQMGRGIANFQEDMASKRAQYNLETQKALSDYRNNILSRMLSASQLQDAARVQFGQLNQFPMSSAQGLLGQSDARSYNPTNVAGQQSFLSSLFGSAGSGAASGAGSALGGMGVAALA